MNSELIYNKKYLKYKRKILSLINYTGGVSTKEFSLALAAVKQN